MPKIRLLWILYNATIFVAFFVALPVILLSRFIGWVFSFNASIWTGAPIINLSINCRLERRIGFRSFSVVRVKYFIHADFDFVLSDFGFDNKIFRFVFEILAFLSICAVAKQVHAYVDGGFLKGMPNRTFNRMELLIYKLLNIKIIVWTYGGDVRTRLLTEDLGRINLCTGCVNRKIACICDVDLGSVNYNLVRKAASVVFSMGDMVHYSQGSNTNLAFWPVDLSDPRYNVHLSEYGRERLNRPLRVLHAPNHREFKGTEFLIDAINQINEKELFCELVIIEKIPNREALEIYKTADVVFDQCKAGFFGFFAVECMAMGKPVMSFLRKENVFIPGRNDCPIINVEPETIFQHLQYIIEHKYDLQEMGWKSREYIEKYWSSDVFVRQLEVEYKNLGLKR